MSMTVIEAVKPTGISDSLGLDDVEGGIDQEVYDEALRWVNDVRAEYGCTARSVLPKGIRGRADGCVIARALSDALSDGTRAPRNGWGVVSCGVSAGEVRFVREGRWQVRPIPDRVQWFIHRFDCGAYPRLELS